MSLLSTSKIFMIIIFVEVDLSSKTANIYITQKISCYTVVGDRDSI